VHIVGVCGVVTNAEDQVLLVRTAHAGWELPGGRVESGEDVHAALRREVREESGYALQGIGRLTGVYCGTASNTVLLVFRASASPTPPEPIDDEDTLEVAWLARSSALEAVTHPSEHQRLADALADLPEAVYRS
jgi:ADP-ribose pyrophosphatase YjhB (NUDIX family)